MNMQRLHLVEIEIEKMTRLLHRAASLVYSLRREVSHNQNRNYVTLVSLPDIKTKFDEQGLPTEHVMYQAAETVERVRISMDMIGKQLDKLDSGI